MTTDKDVAIAPWDDELIAMLQRRQAGETYEHPYTCGNRDDGKHHYINGDLGLLVPTRDGWTCPDCDYTQNWALWPNKAVLKYIERFDVLIAETKELIKRSR